MFEPNLEELRQKGRVVKIDLIKNGTITGVIKGEEFGLLKRGRFFFHQNDLNEPTTLCVGDLVSFLPNPPDFSNQLPHARMVRPEPETEFVSLN